MKVLIRDFTKYSLLILLGIGALILLPSCQDDFNDVEETVQVQNAQATAEERSKEGEVQPIKNCINSKDFSFISATKLIEDSSLIYPLDIENLNELPIFNQEVEESFSELIFISTYEPSIKGFTQIVLSREAKIAGWIVPRGSEKVVIEELAARMGPFADCLTECGGTWQCLIACGYDVIFGEEENPDQTAS